MHAVVQVATAGRRRIALDFNPQVHFAELLLLPTGIFLRNSFGKDAFLRDHPLLAARNINQKDSCTIVQNGSDEELT